MIKKNSLFKWGQAEYEAFNLIKQVIVDAPSLATPNFSDPFILYTFASEKSYAAILTQANKDKEEDLIAFFSSNLQEAELNYYDVEKQAYVVFKAIKHFRPLLLKTHTKIIFPFPAVRNLLVQKDVGEKRANWVTALQEYDTEIKPTNIVKGNAMFEFSLKRGFKLNYSANYYPEGNDLAESKNKNLIKIIKQTIDQNHRNWHKYLMYALWADQITQKASIDTSPFNLVYGKEVILPTHLAIPSLVLVQFIEETPSSSLQLRQLQILKLEEKQEQAKITHVHHQALVKASFDSNMVSMKDFQIGDLVLKWDKAHEEKGKNSKFQWMWLGPFQIVEIIGPSTFMLQDLARKRESLPVNGQILKKYFL
eukprot:PITA_02510